MKTIIRIAIPCIVTLALAGTALAETVVIPGSGNLEYVLGELATAFNGRQSEHRVVVPPSIGTAGALREVTEGAATIGRVGRPLKDAERSAGLVYHPLGRDPVAFVAGAGVRADGITRAQAIDVYSGKLTNWRELGAPAAPIRAIGREVTDASRQAIARDIKAFADLPMAEGVKIVHLDPQMIELLDRFPTSLGFLNRSALGTAKTKVVPLALESVAPSADNVAAGRYPLWLEFGLIYKPGSLTEGGKAFLAFIDSPPAVELLRAHGVLPAPAAR